VFLCDAQQRPGLLYADDRQFPRVQQSYLDEQRGRIALNPREVSPVLPAASPMTFFVEVLQVFDPCSLDA
jgi:hypothetical protein